MAQTISHKMSFTHTQRQKAYKELPEEVQDFIMSNETTEFITTVLKESNLTEEQDDQADSEILYAMLGLQTLDTAIENIARVSGKKVEELDGLKKRFEDEVFSKYPELGKVNQGALKATPQNLPVVEEGEVVHDVQPTTNNQPLTTKENQPPTDNRQTTTTEAKEEVEEVPEEPKPAPVGKVAPSSDVSKDAEALPAKPSAYAGGKDPYREPLE